LTRQQAVIAAIATEILGVLMMVLISRFMPPPANLIFVGVGFLLLFVGPVFLFIARKSKDD
jgi:purine-cytosine permease-like protein